MLSDDDPGAQFAFRVDVEGVGPRSPLQLLKDFIEPAIREAAKEAGGVGEIAIDIENVIHNREADWLRTIGPVQWAGTPTEVYREGEGWYLDMDFAEQGGRTTRVKINIVTPMEAGSYGADLMRRASERMHGLYQVYEQQKHDMLTLGAAWCPACTEEPLPKPTPGTAYELTATRALEKHFQSPEHYTRSHREIGT